MRQAHPRIVRARRPLVRLMQSPPDSAFDDVIAVGLLIVLLILVALVASVFPLGPVR